MRRLKELELENSRLRKAVSDLTLDKFILAEALKGNWDELLDGEIFYSLKEAQVLIEAWRRHYNAIRPHSALGWRPPAPEVRMPGPFTRPARDPLNRMAESPTIH